MKKAIKKLKKQLNAEVIELANAIKEDRKDVVEITIEQNKQIEKLDKRVSNIIIQRENDIEKELLKEQVKKLQFLVNSKNGSIDALSNKLGNLKSDVQTIAKHVQNAEEKVYYLGEVTTGFVEELRGKVKKLENCSCHTNTQKTDKNVTESKQEGKKEQSEPTWFDESSELTQEMFEALKLKARSQAHYETELKKAYDNCFICYDKTGNVIDKPETIITNEMFNEELEKFLKEGNFIYWVSRYTSIDNSRNYICGMITELLNKINRRNQFNFIKELIRSKLKSKGEHYNKESDRYANIKDALARNKEEEPHLFINWTVVDKINSYKDKHIQWLIDTKGITQTKTDLQEAYIDVICYCIMCYIYLKFNGEVKNG